MIAAMAPFALDVAPAPPPVDHDSSLEALLEFCEATEARLNALNAALAAPLSPVQGVTSGVETTRGVDGNDITLFLATIRDIKGFADSL